jgi:hypothetical protein
VATFGELILPTGLSLFLLVTTSRRYSGSVVTFVQENRASVQILVQILSVVLAVLQLNVVKTLLSFRTRLLMTRQYLSLDELAFRAAIIRQHADQTLSRTRFASLAALLVLFAAPGALWAGALTPEVADDLKAFKGIIDIPAFTSSSEQMWNSQFQINSSTGSVSSQVLGRLSTRTPQGFFPQWPVPDLQGLLLISASTATTNDQNQERHHPRLDNAAWTFLGRSYGVGSSPNVAKTYVKDTTVRAIAAYSYLENGYDTLVQCARNRSSDLTFTWQNDLSYSDGGAGTSNLGVYYLQGSLPNDPPGLSEVYPSTAWDQYPNASLLAWAARAFDGRNIFSIATGSPTYKSPDYVPYYTDFNQIQCDITFTPTLFEVFVNTTTKSIRVEPHHGRPAVDPEPTGNLTFNVVASLNLLSRMSNSLYTSVRGDALETNRETVKQRLDRDDYLTTTASVSDSFTAVMDDILVAYGASQLVNAQDTVETEFIAIAPGIQIGKNTYIYVIFAINSGIICLVIYEATRTRFWAGMTAFNFVDMKSAILAASAGGTAIADQITSQPKTRANINIWRGGPLYKASAKVEVMYAEHTANANGGWSTGFYTVKPNERSNEDEAEVRETVRINYYQEGAKAPRDSAAARGIEYHTLPSIYHQENVRE